MERGRFQMFKRTKIERMTIAYELFSISFSQIVYRIYCAAFFQEDFKIRYAVNYMIFPFFIPSY